MKYLIVLSLLFCTIINQPFAQSKIETEEWIKYKIEEYSKCFPGCDNIFFNNGVMYNVQYSNNNFCWKIPLKKIKSVSITKYEEEFPRYQLILKCASTFGDCIEYGIYKNNTFIQENNYDTKPKADIILKITFGNENLPNRMIKAITHLVKLNGGNISKEAF